MKSLHFRGRAGEDLFDGTVDFAPDFFGLEKLAAKVADLAKLVAESRGEQQVQTHTIQCRGVSNESSLVNAFVGVTSLPTHGNKDGLIDMSSGRSYVMCPRLQSFFSGHSYVTVCCEAKVPFDVKITGPERTKETERVLAESKPCPYFRPELKKY